ncbi:helix-turn-helix protein [Thalassoglobus neptunius]|uniref:Helix-turn-helix protein n=1 Tax=Thalassoglobus neptunius TaxID=1938619 RepID=A0A5C5WDP3_9PLAN|nr:helix-turn-helix transcriptional regulator [Thalassoglobus neptunius]TWT48211.1 helix-turn-helix protein [Thalassoglobus neptunius]
MKLILEKQFIDLVNNELKARGWSRSDLAREMGVRPGYITDYLNGRYSPGTDVMERFFDALELQPTLTVKRSKRHLASA